MFERFLENRRFSGILVSLLAGINLFFISKCFYLDWANHVWSINYIGEYFFSHWEFPTVINTPYISGLPIPVFYHSLFGEVFGILCWPLGANISFRILAIVLMYWQFQSLVRLLGKFGARQNICILFATAYTWAPYFLTNIYNRAAMTEWFATVFLTVAICHLFLMLESFAVYDLLIFSTLMSLTIAAHPITGLVGSIFAGVIFLTAFFSGGFSRAQSGYFVAGGFLIGVMSSPWLLALSELKSVIQISERSQEIVKFPSDIDLWWVRNFPFPLDIRVFGNGGEPVSTPNLTAQFSWGLLALVIPTLRGNSKLNSLTKVGFGLFAFFWILSFNEDVWGLVPSFFHIIQFKYRLITFVHLSILVWLMGLVRSNSSFEISKKLSSFILIVSAINVGAKLYQGHQSIRDMDWMPSAEKKLEIPPTYYGLIDYSTVSKFPPLNKEIKFGNSDILRFQVSSKVGEFGVIAPLTVNFPENRIVRFPILPFPWNFVTVNGVGIETAWTLDNFDDGTGQTSRIPAVFLAGIIPKGPATIRLETFPPENYLTLRFFSFSLFVVLLASIIKMRIRSIN